MKSLACLLISIAMAGCASSPCPDISGTYKNENPRHTYHLARLFFEFQYDPSAYSYSRDIVTIATHGSSLLVNTGNQSTTLLRDRDFECSDGAITLTNKFTDRLDAGLVTKSSTSSIELRKLPNGDLMANETKKSSGRILVIPVWSKESSSYSWTAVGQH